MKNVLMLYEFEVAVSSILPSTKVFDEFITLKSREPDGDGSIGFKENE